MAAPDPTWIAHPDVITSAIKALAGAVLLLGGSLVSVLLYIWSQTRNKIDNMSADISKIALSISELAGKVSRDIAEINTRCDERHALRRRHSDAYEGEL